MAAEASTSVHIISIGFRDSKLRQAHELTGVLVVAVMVRIFVTLNSDEASMQPVNMRVTSVITTRDL